MGQKGVPVAPLTSSSKGSAVDIHCALKVKSFWLGKRKNLLSKSNFFKSLLYTYILAYVCARAGQASFFAGVLRSLPGFPMCEAFSGFV